MATNQPNLRTELLHAVFPHHAEDATDGQLLRQFLAQRDESAFVALVRRHGPMMLGVCRRILGNATDADDAFQAAFLVLVRNAPALASRSVLGDWLHGVARRTALKAREAAARRRIKEQTGARPAVQAEEVRNDWLPLLDEAVHCLPEKYRLPIVLCDLEGKTRQEAANQLAWPEGTVAGRLGPRSSVVGETELMRRAQILSGVVPGVLTGSAVQAVLPAVLIRTTVQAATLAATGKGNGTRCADRRGGFDARQRSGANHVLEQNQGERVAGIGKRCPGRGRKLGGAGACSRPTTTPLKVEPAKSKEVLVPGRFT